MCVATESQELFIHRVQCVRALLPERLVLLDEQHVLYMQKTAKVLPVWYWDKSDLRSWLFRLE